MNITATEIKFFGVTSVGTILTNTNLTFISKILFIDLAIDIQIGNFISSEGNQNVELTLEPQESATIQSFSEIFTGEIRGTGELFEILRSSGAGLGIFIQIMGFVLPPIILGILFVGIIVMIGFAIANVINKVRLKE